MMAGLRANRALQFLGVTLLAVGLVPLLYIRLTGSMTSFVLLFFGGLLLVTALVGASLWVIGYSKRSRE